MGGCVATRPYTLLVAPVTLVGAFYLPSLPVPLHDIPTLPPRPVPSQATLASPSTASPCAPPPLPCCSAGHTRLAVNRLSLRDTQGLVGPSKGGGPDSAGVILDMWQVGGVATAPRPM